jgi:cysteine desulfurase family protein
LVSHINPTVDCAVAFAVFSRCTPSQHASGLSLTIGSPALPTESKIYLDHAATSWPKDESVYAAVEHQMRRVGVAAGRGGYDRAVAGGRQIEDCRLLAGQLFHSDPGGHWVLTTSGTTALNQAIHGLVATGDHVVTTTAEHNSVLRPLQWLRRHRSVRVSTVPCDRLGRVDPQSVLGAIDADTRLIAVTHGSNVTGACNNVQEIASGIARSANPDCLLLVDAAQTAGQIPLDLRNLRCDLLAMPGHKSLGGPLGTGLLYVGPRAVGAIQPIFQGGTGSRSDALEMPESLPGRLESGNQNVPAIAGLAAGLRICLETDLAAIQQANQLRVVEMMNALSTIDQVRVITAGDLPIVSIVIDDLQPHDAAAILDGEFDIETRAGLHCAPLIHSAIGTDPAGTLRLSFDHRTTNADLAAAVAAIREIAAD